MQMREKYAMAMIDCDVSKGIFVTNGDFGCILWEKRRSKK